MDVKSAEALALEDRYKFEWWALDLVDARPAQDKKKGSDRSIDGIIYFQEKTGGKYHKIIVQVKSGKVGVSQIMELKGAIEREKAVIGAFITLNPPTRRMMEESAAAGFYESEDFPGHRFPRLQILTVADLFAGKKLEYPHWAIQATFKKPPLSARGATLRITRRIYCDWRPLETRTIPRRHPAPPHPRAHRGDGLPLPGVRR